VQYTGTVTWSPTRGSFAPSTIYTAIISLTAKHGFTLDGVGADFFKVDVAQASNAKSSNVIIAVFPKTEAPYLIEPVTDFEITGIRIPVYGESPVLSIEEEQFTGTVIWNPRHDVFAANTEYIAIITLSAEPGFVFENIFTNVFTVIGAEETTNTANSNVVTAVFPRTEIPQYETVSIKEIQGLNAIFGIPPATVITPTDQFTGTVTWSPNHSTFQRGYVYTATIILTAVYGYTFHGVEQDFFTVATASASNNANSRTVTAVFPAIPSVAVSIREIPGLTPPAVGGTPVRSISTAQYTGAVTWQPDDAVFAIGTQYTAYINLTAEIGFHLQGIQSNFFTVEGASSVTYNDGVVTVIFPHADGASNTELNNEQ